MSNEIIESSIDSLDSPQLWEKPGTRRGFLMGTGAAGVGLVLAACGSSSSSSSASTSSSPVSSSGGGPSDADVAKIAAGLEVLAVGTYKAALDAATANKLGAVPPAVATFATTAMGQHQAALDKWNGIITGGGGQAVAAPPADLKATVDKAFAQVTDVVGLAKLALLLEQTAADTYFAAVSTLLKDKAAIQLAGSIQIIDQQHQAILLYVLGMYPVPDVFQKGDKAYTGSGSSSGSGAPAPSPT